MTMAFSVFFKIQRIESKRNGISEALECSNSRILIASTLLLCYTKTNYGLRCYAKIKRIERNSRFGKQQRF
jgi:hypothetical protein